MIDYCCFSVTMKCALECKVCHIWKQENDLSRELPVEKWKEALRYLPGFLNKGSDIVITGGEPLLKNGVLDLIAECSRRGYKVSLQTNGLLIDREMAKELNDLKLWRACISLHSLKESVHDFLRGKIGAHKKSLEAIDNLARFSPDTGINIQTLIMETNLEELIGMADWVEKDARLDYILYLAPMLPFGAHKDESWFTRDDYKFMWPRNSERVKFILDDLAGKKVYCPKIANPAAQLEVFKKYFDRSLTDDRTRCGLGSRGVNIDPEGNVFLCFAYPPIGNIKENSLPQIWESAAAEKVRTQMRDCTHKCHFLLNCSFRENELSENLTER